MILDPVTAALIGQGARFAIQTYFSYMQASGATPEEIDANFAAEKLEFEKRPFSALPAPPE